MKKAKDMSKLHENKESTMEEGKETKMEKKGYKETESGQMVKSAKGGMTKSQKKVGKVMSEFKAGKLHSGKSKKIVKNPKQAIAIALSEAGKSKKMMKAASGDMADSSNGISAMSEAMSKEEYLKQLEETKSRYLEKAQRMLGEPNLKEAMGPADKRSIVDKGKDLFRNVKEKIKQDPGMMGTGDPKRLMRKKGGGIAIAGMGAAYKSGGSVQARGVKLARTRPTKLY